MSDQTTVIELPAREGLAAQIAPAMNHHLMVAWINADLITRATHDVRTSIVLYDADGDFVAAVPDSIAELSAFPEILQRLFNETSVRFYSKGVR